MDRSITHILAKQRGVISRAQALEDGLTDRQIRYRVATRAWIRVHPGVYRLATHPATWEQELFAACLACGAGSLVSHRAASALFGLPSVSAELVEVTSRRTHQLEGVVIRRIQQPLGVPDTAVFDGIPVTSVARTLLDVATLVPADDVEVALDHALSHGMVSLHALHRAMERFPRGAGRGTRTMSTLLRGRNSLSGTPESPPETRFAQRFRRARIPDLVAQYWVRDALGRMRLDFAIPSLLIGIEVQSRHHDGVTRRRKDAARRNRLMALDWVVLEFDEADLSRFEEVLEVLRTTIAARRIHYLAP